MGGIKIEAPRGEAWGRGVPLPTGGGVRVGGCAPSLEKNCFFASKSHVCDALLHPFEVILLLVENEQQCTKWFILQCYRQPNIAHGSRSRRILQYASNRSPPPPNGWFCANCAS